MPKCDHKKVCASCGKSHRAFSDICHSCKRKIKYQKGFKTCALCGAEFNTKDRGKGQSPYCSYECSSLVSEARCTITAIVAKAIRSGFIDKAKNHKCVDCGNAAMDYEHRSYMKPLDVVPVCRPCNLKRGPAVDIAEFVSDYLIGKAKKAKRKAA